MNSETVQDAKARVEQWLASEYPLGMGVSAETGDAVREIPGATEFQFLYCSSEHWLCAICARGLVLIH